jgi:hypothetical protein
MCSARVRICCTTAASALSVPRGNSTIQQSLKSATNVFDERVSWRKQYIRLQQLEAEAIAIFREGVASFPNPVMLYSTGKDSSAMLHIRHDLEIKLVAWMPRRSPMRSSRV